MSTPQSIRPATTRVVLARLAERVIAEEDGVSATAGGGRWLTRDGDRDLDGVVVGASASGHLDVDLHLLAAWPPLPLPEVSARLRRRLSAAAASTGIESRLGRVDVTVHDVVEPAGSGAEG
jgi:hypothetical protein